jgi:hypothetical protein
MKMIKKILSATFMLAVSAAVTAQTNTDLSSDLNAKINKTGRKYDSTKVWNKGGSISLTLGNTALSNWAGGGSNSFSFNGTVNLYADYKKNKDNWDNNLNVQYGYLKTQNVIGQSSANLFDFLSLYGHSLTSKLDASALFRLRTQPFDGYTYTTDPDGVVTGAFSSTFFAPAYVTLAPGITWKPVKKLNIFFSPVAARLLVVANKRLSDAGMYGVDTGKTCKFEFGALLNAGYATNITKTITYAGNLELYSDYLHNPQNIYIFWTNTFAAKITKLISVTWNFNLAYDDLYRPTPGKGPKLQTQSILGVGFLYNW